MIVFLQAMKNRIFLLITLIPSMAFGQDQDTTTWPFFKPKNYIAYKTNEQLVIDGICSEASWAQALWTDFFTDIEGSSKPEPLFKTRAKMMWDDSCFYFYAELEEPHVWGDITVKDAVIFHNNDIEIFMKPFDDSPQYGELEVNALGTIWDLLLTKPYHDGGLALNDWDIKGLQVCVNIDGTINNPSNIDHGWSVEIAVPWKSLKGLGSKNSKQEIPIIWRINFSRVEWKYEIIDGKYNRKKDENGKLLPENNWVWSPQGVIDMHQPEKWGFVKFSDKEPGQDTLETDPYLGFTLALKHLYQLEKKYYKVNGSYSSKLQKLEPLKFVFNDVRYIPFIEMTNSGYKISFNLKNERIKITINEKGNIKKLKY